MFRKYHSTPRQTGKKFIADLPEEKGKMK